MPPRTSHLVDIEDQPAHPASNSVSRSCNFTASEPSSGASSRNPSPVSIISSSASSSIGSTTAVDSDNR